MEEGGAITRSVPVRRALPMNVSDSRGCLRRRTDLLLNLVVHLHNFAKEHRGLTGGLSPKEKDSNDSVATHHVVGLV